MSTSSTQVHDDALAQSGWGLRVRLWQPHNPAFWLYWWFILNGTFLYIQSLADYRVSPGSLTLAIFLQTLYTLPFVWFITRRDHFRREPAKLCVLGFLWGGLVATWMYAAPANGPLINLYAKWFGIDWAETWGPSFAAPFTEETAKLTGILILVLLARQHVRTVYDGMLLGMFVGLGFQVFENVHYLVNVAQANYNSKPVGDILLTFGIRGVTGVGGHWLFSALCGAGVGYYLATTDKSKPRRLLGAAGFVALAMVIHGIFDAVGGLGMGALVVTIIVLLVAAAIVFAYAQRRTRGWMRVLLADEVRTGMVGQDELDVLAGPHKQRKRYLKRIKKADGKAAAKRAGYVLDAVTDLAAAIAATDDPTSPDAAFAREEVARVRALPIE